VVSAVPLPRRAPQNARLMDEPAAPPLDAHFAAAYADLRRLARSRLRSGGRSTVLDTTALVHESYLRLSRGGEATFPDRARFLVYAGKAMRSIIIDLVRERQAERRGGSAPHLTLTSGEADALPQPGGEEHILRVNEALEALARQDARMAQVVEMKYFAGLTEAEIGQALGVTDRTVRRDWEQARLFLAEALR
jgi:RNA polymerase sigma factor (TIGR02999 family)